MQEDISKKLKYLNEKVKDFETKKIRAEKELELLNSQYEELVKELNEKGITDVTNLSNIIKNLETEFYNELHNATNEIEEIEKKLLSIEEKANTEN